MRQLAPVVQKADNAIQQINLYSMDTTIGFPNTQLYSDFTMQLLNNWGQQWDSYFSFGFCWFQDSYAISTSSGRVDLTQLNSYRNSYIFERQGYSAFTYRLEVHVYYKFWSHLAESSGLATPINCARKPFGIVWKKEHFFPFLNEALLAYFRRLHQSPELLCRQISLFLSFIHGSIYFSFFPWANLSETN